MKKLHCMTTTCAILAASAVLASQANAKVVTGFKGAGNDTAATTVTWSNLTGVVTVKAPGVGNPTIGGVDNMFGATNSTGTIAMRVVALSDDTQAFNPTNWIGGSTGGVTVIQTTTAGWGVNDAVSGNGNIQPGEALILTFELDNLALATDHILKFTGIGLAVSSGQLWQRTGESNGVLVAEGTSILLPSLILEDGDTFALVNTLSTAMRLTDLALEIRALPTNVETPTGLDALAGDTVALLDWDDDLTGFLDYYTVYRSTVSGTNNYVALTNVASSAFIDTALANGTTYYYAVTAIGTNGFETGYSDEISSTPVAASTNTVLFQHLDATVPASVTLSNVNEVVSWADQSGSGNNATALDEVPVLYPSASLSGSGLSGVDVRTNRAVMTLLTAVVSESVLDFRGAAQTNSGFAVLVAFKADSVATNVNNHAVLGNGNFGLRYEGDGTMEANLGGSLISKAGATVTAGDTIVYAFNYTAPSGIMEFWDSKSESLDTLAATIYGDFSAGSLILAGGGNKNMFMDGMVGEVQIYSSRLSPSEFAAKREALAAKWGASSGAYGLWAATYGVGTETENPDNDALDNLAEYAMGGNPTNGADVGLVPVLAKGVGEMIYVHAVRTDDSSLSYYLETNSDLVYGTWTNSGYTVLGTDVTGSTFDFVSNSVPTTAPKTFIRLRIAK